jgi:hypothetical protein
MLICFTKNNKITDMETIAKLNYGQHMLFSYLCISTSGRIDAVLTTEQLESIIESVLELTDEKYYDYKIEDCPDYLIMTNPQESYNIFCDWYDENEEYFVTL